MWIPFRVSVMECVAAACMWLLIGVFVGGCTIKPDAPGPAVHVSAPVGASHPAIKVKAAGLKPILAEYMPKLQGAIHGDFIQAVPGVEADIGAPLEVNISETPDGRVLIEFSNGQRIRIDKRVLGFIRVQGTETIDSLTLDPGGVDVKLRDSLISGVRLEATDD